MTKYEELCEQAHSEQIEIKNVDVPVPGMSAVYIRAMGDKCVFLKPTAARNTDDIYEIADVLSVTVDFLTEAISDYVTKGLWPSCPIAL